MYFDITLIIPLKYIVPSLYDILVFVVQTREIEKKDFHEKDTLIFVTFISH